LRAEGICIRKKRSRRVSKDPDFAGKADDVAGSCLNPPEGAVILSVDKKQGIQALERARGFVRTTAGKTVQGHGGTCVRHGALDMFAALDAETGNVPPFFF
jgi:hypothetical protein